MWFAVSSRKLVRNGPSMNDTYQKRSTEEKNSHEKNVKKKLQKDQKKKVNVAAKK